MSKKSDTMYFKIPEALAFGWSFKMMVEHIVDRMPQFASVSGARKGGKLIEAVEKAETDPAGIVVWPTELWEQVKNYLNSDSFAMPQNQIFRNGVPTDQIVPRRLYLPQVDAILEASEVAPKSVATDKPPQAEEAVEEAPATEAPVN